LKRGRWKAEGSRCLEVAEDRVIRLLAVCLLRELTFLDRTRNKLTCKLRVQCSGIRDVGVSVTDRSFSKHHLLEDLMT
jgi:hypothetical protein